jgi:hypothetical protein
MWVHWFGGEFSSLIIKILTIFLIFLNNQTTFQKPTKIIVSTSWSHPVQIHQKNKVK